MTDTNNTKDAAPRKVLSLGGTKPKVEAKKQSTESGSGGVAGAAERARQTLSHGRSRVVEVVRDRRRTTSVSSAGSAGGSVAAAPSPRPMGAVSDAGALRSATLSSTTPSRKTDDKPSAQTTPAVGRSSARTLTKDERDARLRALRGVALESELRRTSIIVAEQGAGTAGVAAGTDDGQTTAAAVPEVDAPQLSVRERLRLRELEELRQIREQEKSEASTREANDRMRATAAKKTDNTTPAAIGRPTTRNAIDEESDDQRRRGRGGAGVPAPKRGGTSSERRRGGKITVSQALETSEDGDGGGTRRRSVASIRRRIERNKRQAQQSIEQPRIIRDVIIPETLTVQELSNRMAERAADVIKTLMKMGVLATITQSLDADTAELVATEFGHRVRRVAESDVESSIDVQEEVESDLVPRPPVVTVMGHVDHGKTSLLDALRRTNVTSGEAGGITQHIGAYQVIMPKPLYGFDRITFIDTPGHSAFTEMRARGANITDVVVLVVAANDGIMPQTIEAIRHAKAANAAMVVAINKCDLPDANPARVRQDLLQYDVQVEEMGGEVLAVEISAKKGTGLDKLLEAILLQAEILSLRANPNRAARGVVIEAKLEKGRGSVATVLIRSGTLRIGDIFVAGSESGRVRALINDHEQSITEATPSMPVEVLGLSGNPVAGDDFIVVPTEAKAREISAFRTRQRRALAMKASSRGSLEQMFANIRTGSLKELCILIKGDAHGSIEALRSSLSNLTANNEEVRVRILDAAVGAITESDVTLANASNGFIIGFNVRATPEAREMARRDGVDVRYYSIIYNAIDDVRQALTGLLAPEIRETIIGNAQILQIFNITRVGKVAGCRVTDGIVKRGAKVRLLRDNVVVHEGTLRTLKRLKDEVREVREGLECGMAFENYDNIEVGDVIECVEVEEIAREFKEKI